MKTFKYKDYKNCFFVVGQYAHGDNAMAISIENMTEGAIATCTVLHDFGIYIEHITTIKNYGENANMTKFLEELGIVTDIISKFPCNSYVNNATETIDICVIDTNKLKEYTKEWYYNVH